MVNKPGELRTDLKGVGLESAGESLRMICIIGITTELVNPDMTLPQPRQCYDNHIPVNLYHQCVFPL